METNLFCYDQDINTIILRLDDIKTKIEELTSNIENNVNMTYKNVIKIICFLWSMYFRLNETLDAKMQEELYFGEINLKENFEKTDVLI